MADVRRETTVRQKRPVEASDVVVEVSNLRRPASVLRIRSFHEEKCVQASPNGWLAGSNVSG